MASLIYVQRSMRPKDANTIATTVDASPSLRQSKMVDLDLRFTSA